MTNEDLLCAVTLAMIKSEIDSVERIQRATNIAESEKWKYIKDIVTNGVGVFFKFYEIYQSSVFTTLCKRKNWKFWPNICIIVWILKPIENDFKICSNRRKKFDHSLWIFELIFSFLILGRRRPSLCRHARPHRSFRLPPSVFRLLHWLRLSCDHCTKVH